MKAVKVALGLTVALAWAIGCSEDDSNGEASTTGGSDAGPDTSIAEPTTTTPDATTADAAPAVVPATVAPVVPATCQALATHIEQLVCATDAFNALLSDAQRTSVNYAFSNAVAKTYWSNLPGVTRSGIKLGSLTVEQIAAAKGVAKLALGDAGYADYDGILAADDYLGSLNGSGGGGAPGGGGGGGGPPDGGGAGGPPGGGDGGGPGGGMGTGGGGGGAGLAYASANSIIAVYGAPSATGDWMLQLGNHHLAFNITYRAGVGYPTPTHQGAEPKDSFVVNGGTYAPLAEEGAAMKGVFASLEAATLASAYLTGSFPDVVVGPVEFGKGVYATSSFPSGANRKGVLVSSLTSAQQALVTKAIEGWVRDFAPATSDPLVAAYSSAAAYADTYIAWGGTQSAGVDVDVNGTYMRIDGPRVWIEVACQGGIVIQGKTHYHTIYRDKEWDYGKAL